MKKTFLAILMATLMLSSLLAFNVNAAESGTSYGDVPVSADAIEIDGEMDEIYEYGLVVPIEVPDKGTASDKTTGVAYLLWNGDDTLYVYVEVYDSEIIVYDGQPNAWMTDSVELFLDYSNKNARTRDQYRIDIKNVATYYVTETITGEDTKEYGFEDWAQADIDGGYALEFELLAYKEKISADMNIGFHLMINNMIKDGTRGMVHSDACGNDPAKFGYITLVADEVAVPVEEVPATSETKAPSTFDPAITAIAAFSLASGIFVVSKKRK